MNRAGFFALLVVCSLTVALAGCPDSSQREPSVQRVKKGVVLDGHEVGGMSRQQLDKTLDSLAQGLDRPVRVARIEPKSGETVSGANGQRLDRKATEQAVMKARDGQAVHAIVRTVAQPFSAGALTEGPSASQDLTVVANFRTPIKDARPGRMHNLSIASRTLSGSRLAPGAVFSFNRIVGATPTPQQGYLPAPVIDDSGHKVMDYGGGLCQISTTIYNAALMAKLPIVERHPHSKPVSYVANGKDAAVYTDKDLRFRNDRRYPLYLFVQTDAGGVRVYLARSSRDTAPNSSATSSR